MSWTGHLRVNGILRFVTPLAWPETLIAPIVIAWIVLGIALGLYLARSRSRGPDGVADLYGGTPAAAEVAELPHGSQA